MKNSTKLVGISIVMATVMWGSNTLAQRRSFFFPSASFFSPTAAFLQSETGIFEALETMENHQTFYSYITPEFVEENLGNYMTVLAPTDKAFANLSPDVKAKLDDPENVEKLLKYHLVSGKITDEDIKRQAVATMLEQTSVSITGIQVQDGVDVKLNDANATEPSDPFRDGIIIPIDQVLIPPGF